MLFCLVIFIIIIFFNRMETTIEVVEVEEEKGVVEEEDLGKGEAVPLVATVGEAPHNSKQSGPKLKTCNKC